MSTLRNALLAWWDGGGAGRDLPWRGTRDPWSILVSEVMLQQTQAARVVPSWEAFLRRFPTPPACARAEGGDVVRAWAGLGYNRRAVALHALARTVTADNGGRLPGTLAGLQALPGVGPYTARAVLAFAFEAAYGVLDTNATRVLARAVAGRAMHRGEAQRLADGVVPPGRAWDWNQAVLDLGATCCTSGAPACSRCPIARWCAWKGAEARGVDEPDPAVTTAGRQRRQPPFVGSDRQGRGRLVAALRVGPVVRADLATIMGWPDDPQRAARVAAAVVADGLAAEDGEGLSLGPVRDGSPAPAPPRAAPAPPLCPPAGGSPWSHRFTGG